MGEAAKQSTLEDVRRIALEAVKRGALLRVRAKAFARRLRSEGWAEAIPDEDIAWLKDSEIETYKEVLRQQQCVQRPDFKWERAR